MTDFAKRLIDWYQVHQRLLPWREKPNFYHVLVSEIMLQQTRVETVLEYYLRFLEKFPTLESLAYADEEDCLKAWEGLGYYSRVRNLHKAAAEIVINRHGGLPDTPEKLRSVPGIGPYTADAVASIVFGVSVPAIDGNLLRVFARITCYGQSIRSSSARESARHFYLEKMKHTLTEVEQDLDFDPFPGNFNQALMDLGACICLPNGKPDCRHCPLAGLCLSHQKGTEMDFPVSEEKPVRPEEKRTVFLIRDAMKIVLRKRPEKGLLAGLWEFPNTEGHLNEDEALQYVQGLGFSPLRIRRLPAARHVFTHKVWDMIGYEILADELTPARILPTISEPAARRNRNLKENDNQKAPALEDAEIRSGDSGEKYPKLMPDFMGTVSSREADSQQVPGNTGTPALQREAADPHKTSENQGDAMPLRLASIRELDQKYAVPSAFRVYRNRL